MSRFVGLFIVAVFIVALFAAPVYAQETVTENPTVDATALYNTALVVIGAIVVVAFGVFGYIVRPAIAGAVAGMPEWSAKMLFSAGDAGMDALEDYAERTPSPIDDQEIAKLRAAYDELKLEVERLRTYVNTTAVG